MQHLLDRQRLATSGCSGAMATAAPPIHGYMNDLWRYDPATKQWTWISGSNTINQAGIYGTKGVPDAANVPCARYMSISWADSPAICGSSGAAVTKHGIGLFERSVAL